MHTVNRFTVESQIDRQHALASFWDSRAALAAYQLSVTQLALARAGWVRLRDFGTLMAERTHDRRLVPFRNTRRVRRFAHSL